MSFIQKKNDDGILVNSKAFEVWFKLVRNFTPTRSLQFHQKHDDVCDRESNSGTFGRALRRTGAIDNTHYTAVQRMFGLPKLKASLRDQEGAGGRS
ncbi:BQ5605_C061g12740 [Microbotryum silenes-dioicae]|uniref:BQ5605_C061g12740 protein n=1 Tax=Microbotryum silenes-dioicae TaxID=796604 RepID=A0A2X0ND67_9BASI|nr:BQ5605_C061g12740 [Microbotryum silenes-dioicae]